MLPVLPRLKKYGNPGPGGGRKGGLGWGEGEFCEQQGVKGRKYRERGRRVQRYRVTRGKKMVEKGEVSCEL